MELVKIGETDGLMILADGKGNTAAFEFLEMYVLDGAEYAVLLQNGDDMVTILRLEETDGGGERYYPVEDDETFEEVYRRFAADHEDEFLFE